MIPNRIQLLCLLILLALLSGCKEQVLYSKLSERDANEMVALLISAGLPAVKASDKGQLYKVLVNDNAFADAVHLLHLNGLPKETYDNLGQVFAKEGFVSSPLEERARLNFALSQEIASTLSNVDGVLLARVHLAVPPRDELGDQTEPASASVFIKHRGDVDLSGSTGMIKNLVVNGIENLSYDNVTVAFFKSGAMPLGVKPAGNSSLSVDGTGNLQLGLLPQIDSKHLFWLLAGLSFVLLMLTAWHFKVARSNRHELRNRVPPGEGNDDT